MPLATSRNGLLFIACREAIALVAYQDGTHCSIGCGHNDPTLRLGDRITVKRAFELLKADVTRRDLVLNKALKVALSQQQHDALSSLQYQSGNRYFPRVVERINAGDLAGAAALFPGFNQNAAGKPLPGLTKRRLLEQALFARGDYGALDPIPLYPEDLRVSRKQQPYRLQPSDL